MRRVEPAPVDPTATDGATKVARRQSSPYTGKLSARPAGKPGDFLIAKEGLRRCLPRHCFAQLQRTITILGAQYAFSKAWRNLSGPMWFEKQNQTLGRDRAASRRSAPGPGSRTCREDHAPSHRPQMSSGRLFLDRVARQQSPSPLRRYRQSNTHSAEAQARGDVSTLPVGGTFLLCLDISLFTFQD